MLSIGLKACTDGSVSVDAKRRAGMIGGRVRSDRMTPEQRKAAAADAANKRWVEWRRRRRIEAGY